MSRLLRRSDIVSARRPAPVRQVHLGLGAFHRAHQLAYTDTSDERSEWGVASFTGRRPEVAPVLEAQGGLYTLVERGPQRDRLRVIHALSHAYDGADLLQLLDLVASRDVALVTLTITEAGYCLGADGALDLSSITVACDLAIVRELRGCSDFEFRARVIDAPPKTAMARLVVALEARRRSHGEPIAVVPCDNLPANGDLVSSIVGEFGRAIGEDFTTWVRDSIDFVSASVDRITPATTEGDRAEVERTNGYFDRAVVVTEPFSDWVLSGEFRSGRPQWETAGAQFVDDIEPFENRKLWMLNGAHTYLASAGRLLGYETVAQAIADDTLLDATIELWDEVEGCLPGANLQLADYRAALLARFGNARIEHRLEQIATDTVTKLAVRVAPVALGQLSAGRSARASARVVGSWVAALELAPPVNDSREGDIAAAMSSTPPSDQHRSLVRLVSDELAQHDEFVSHVGQFVHQFQATPTAPRRSTP